MSSKSIVILLLMFIDLRVRLKSIISKITEYKTWSEKSINRRIFNAILSISAITFLVKLVNLGKEIYVASLFGTNDLMDAYFIAFLLPSFGIGVIARSFNAALIPTFIQVRDNQGKEAAQRLFSSAVLLSTVLLFFVAFLMILASPFLLPLIATGFDEQKIQLAHKVFLVLVPTMVFSGLTSTWSAILNANEQFTITSIVPVVKPVAIVAVLILLYGKWGIYALATGTLLGFVLESSILVKILKREGFFLTPNWTGLTPELRQVVGQYIPMILSVFIMSSANFVDQSMAAMLGAGSVSILNYGKRVVGILLELTSTAMSTAILPHFSRMATANDWKGLQNTYWTYVRLILVLSIIPTLLLSYCSEYIVSILFERGAFNESDTLAVANVQSIYFLQIPIYILVSLNVRMITSIKKNKILIYISVVNLIFNISLNYILMKWIGVSGIALSTVIVYIIGFLISFIIIKRVFSINSNF